jgi:hypothetical protein
MSLEKITSFASDSFHHYLLPCLYWVGKQIIQLPSPLRSSWRSWNGAAEIAGRVMTISLGLGAAFLAIVTLKPSRVSTTPPPSPRRPDGGNRDSSNVLPNNTSSPQPAPGVAGLTPYAPPPPAEEKAVPPGAQKEEPAKLDPVVGLDPFLPPPVAPAAIPTAKAPSECVDGSDRTEEEKKETSKIPAAAEHGPLPAASPVLDSTSSAPHSPIGPTEPIAPPVLHPLSLSVFSKSRPTVQEMKASIEEHARELQALSEDLTQGLKSGDAEAAATFEKRAKHFNERLRIFQNLYGPFEKILGPDFPTLFPSVRHYKAEFAWMRDVVRGIIRVKGDGNCLFHSFVEQFRDVRDALIQVGVWKDQLLNHEFLRGSVSAWIKANLETDETLKMLVDQAIDTHLEAKYIEIPRERESEQSKLELASDPILGKELEIDVNAVLAALAKLSQEEAELEELKGPKKYAIYLSKIDNLGFFATFAEAYAMCKILNEKIGIRIQIETDGELRNAYDAFNEDAPIKLTLIFKGDHFDKGPARILSAQLA